MLNKKTWLVLNINIRKNLWFLISQSWDVLKILMNLLKNQNNKARNKLQFSICLLNNRIKRKNNTQICKIN